MHFEFNEKTKTYQKRLVDFMNEHIYPIEYEFQKFVNDHPGKVYPDLESLKHKARAAGLWNLFLPIEYGEFSGGLTNLEYAPLAQEMGKVPWASEVFNCNAPDTGNMEVLAKYGTELQQAEWLLPLLNGNIRSAFLMTEPDVASSDARNIQTSIIKDGDEYVINGIKWWSTNANHPNCKVYIVMGKTDSNAQPHQQQSMIIVPKNTPGVTTIRSLPVFNYHDRPGEHLEIKLDNVRVPATNILAGEGKGFEIAQGRLGPGRIHHCMRLIGQAERTLDYMCRRVNERVTFGKLLKDQSSIRQLIARAFCDFEQARLLVLSAADKIDRKGIKEAKDLIAAIKIVVPRMTCDIVDEAMQIFGGKGLSNDTPLVQYYTAARALRLADGPDEVHMYQLGRNLIKKYLNKDNIQTPYFDEMEK